MVKEETNALTYSFLGSLVDSLVHERTNERMLQAALIRTKKLRGAEKAIAKHEANTLHKAADTAIQLCGARGYSKDTLLEWIYRYARQARLVDGASEVHKMVLSRFYLKEKRDFFQWG